MSLILNSSGMKITSDTDKVLFDSSRQSPHVVSSVSGTINSNGNLPGYASAQFIYERALYDSGYECLYQQWAEYYDPFFTVNKTFVLPYYKVSLPISNTIVGAYPIGETNGNWISANGGLLLRAYASRSKWDPKEGVLQGTQFVHAYCPMDGVLRVEVVTNIFGHVSSVDAISTFYLINSTGNVPITVPHTTYVVDYKIFIGAI